MKFDQDEFQFTWINSDTLRICYSVNGAYITLLTFSIRKHIRRAATHLFKRRTINRDFFPSKLSNFYFDLRHPGEDPHADPWQDGGAKIRPQGQLECENPRGSPGGDGQAWN